MVTKSLPPHLVPVGGDKVSLLTHDGRVMTGLLVHERHMDLANDLNCIIYLVDVDDFPSAPTAEGEEWRA